MVFCNNVEKPHAKNEAKSIYEIQTYANVSYICAPRPVGRIDHSRFERVKHLISRLMLALEQKLFIY